MPTVKLVSDADAEGIAREVFDDIKASKEIDFVPNIWRALAIHPPHLRDTWNRLKTTMADGALDKRTKEMIALAVSITNGCAYCIHSHTAALRKLGLSDQALGELVAVVDLFNATNRIAEAYQIEPDVKPPVD